MARHDVGSIVDFPEQLGVRVRAGQRMVAVFRVGTQLFAVDDACPHRGFPLHDGSVHGESVRCRSHGSCFNLRTGALERGPAGRGIHAYAACIVGDRVAVEIPDAAD